MSIVKSFSVGNGDMFYIKHNSDNFTTIDCCLEYEASSKEREDEIIAEIREQSKDKGITRFISTHPDEDHISGLQYYDDCISIVNFYRVDNNATKNSDESNDFKRYKSLRDNSSKSFALKRGCSRKWMNQNDETRGSSGLFCLWPIISNDKYKTALDKAQNGESPNNISPAIRYAIEQSASFLWMGDMETDMQEEFSSCVSVPATTIVFAPHHGRKSGRIPTELLESLSPKVIVVGEAPCEDLHYYSGYNTITQNSAGDIVFDVNGDIVDIFVSNSDYKKKDWMHINGNHGYHNGLYYIGSIKV